jgi:hypothetical protein
MNKDIDRNLILKVILIILVGLGAFWLFAGGLFFNFDRGGDLASVSIPSGDKILGNNDANGEVGYGNRNAMVGARFVMPAESGQANKIWVYIDNAEAGSQYALAVYSDNSNQPGTLLTQAGNGTVSATGWHSADLNLPLTAGTAYWLVYNTNASLPSNNVQRITQGGGRSAWRFFQFGTWPEQFGTANGFSENSPAILLIYTPEGTTTVIDEPVTIPPEPEPEDEVIDEPPPSTVVKILGFDQVGTKIGYGSRNAVVVARFTMPAESGQAESISVYIDNPEANTSFGVGIYDDSKGSPGTLLVNSYVQKVSSTGWHTVPIDFALTPGTTYWLAYNTDASSPSSNIVRYSPGGQDQTKWRFFWFGLGHWPKKFGKIDGISSEVPSIYLSYRTAGTVIVPLEEKIIDEPVSVGAPRRAVLGVNLEGNDDWQRANMFVDVVKQTRGFWYATSFTAEGWPVGDFEMHAISSANCVVAGAGGCESTAGSRNPDISGTYSLSFRGQAKVLASGAAVNDLAYNSSTGISTAKVVIPTGGTDLVVYFKETGGRAITDIKLIRPGYAANTTQTFTDEFLSAIEPFQTLRLMDYLKTNWSLFANTSERLAKFGPTMEWSERTPKTKPTQEGPAGGSIEYMVELANTANKDLWLNIPHLASEDYLRGLATYLKDNLETERKVYLEFSNEAWNFAVFAQPKMVLDQALAYIASGQLPLLNNPTSNDYYYTRRFTLKRAVDTSLIFREIFGNSAMMTRIRPVFADQVGNPEQMSNALMWLNRSYANPPSYYLYGLAGAPYYVSSNGGTVDQIIAGISERINARLGGEISHPGELRLAYYYTIAQAYGLENLSYEGGLDLQYIKEKQLADLATVIAVSYDQRMEEVTAGYLRQWYACGGDGFMYFNLTSVFNQHGQWGLTDDILRDYQSPSAMNPKMKGARKVVAEDARTFECARFGTGFYAKTADGVLGDGTGLTGTYYQDAEFGTVAVTRVDPVINFVWANFLTGNPYPDKNAYGAVKYFSAQWRGQVLPKFSGTYTFGIDAESDDTANLTVGGQALGRGGQVVMEAGTKYDIEITYKPNATGGRARLWWELPGKQVKAMIPESQLYPL